MISCEVSLYPMDTQDSDRIINSSIESLKRQGIACDIGSISTYFSGDPDKVWHGLRTLYETAQKEGKEVAMVVTIANSRK